MRTPQWENLAITDLFEEPVPYDKSLPQRDYNNGLNVGHYCYISPGGGMEERMEHFQTISLFPRKPLAQWLGENLLSIDYDTLHWKIIVFEDTFDLYVSYGQILGTRLVLRTSNKHLPDWIDCGRTTNEHLHLLGQSGRLVAAPENA